MMKDNLSQVSSHKSSLKIYKQVYELPILANENFLQLQEKIQNRQRLIKDAKRFKGKFLGIFERFEKVSFKEQVFELERLITDYDVMIQFIQKHKDAYRKFFTELTEELKIVFTQKIQELHQVEQKRRELELNLPENSVLLATLNNQKEQIANNVFILYRSAQLILKKVELISKSIQKLSEDQDMQKRLLDKIMNSLKDYHKVYILQTEIDRLQVDIEILANIAINFEQSMSTCLSPFQGVIDQVVKVDDELSLIVEQIRVLAEDLVDGDCTLLVSEQPEKFSENLIQFLTTSQQKQERLKEGLEESQRETLSSLDNFKVPNNILEVTSLTDTLDSIQLDFENRMNQFSVDLNPNLKFKLAQKYNQQGLAEYEKEDYQKAKNKFSQALELNPQLAEAFVYRGDSYYQLKEYQKALEDYSEAMAIEPNDSQIQEKWDKTFYELEKSQQTSNEYQHILTTNPNLKFKLAEKYNQQGLAEYEKEDYQKAKSKFSQALEFDPKLIQAFVNRGDSYYQLKEYQKALDDYSQVMTIDPNHSQIEEKWVKTHCELHTPQQESDKYQQIFSLNPNLKLKLAEKYYQKAKNKFSQALELNPQLAEAFVYRGDSYYQLKEYQQALEDYSEAMATDANHSQIQKKWDNTFYELEKSQQVPNKYRQILTANPNLKSKLAEKYFPGSNALQRKL
jgi:tetratricopeptide (TPR) repeat protein